MNAITRLERWLDRRLGGPVIEGTEPDGWLTALSPETVCVHGEPNEACARHYGTPFRTFREGDVRG